MILLNQIPRGQLSELSAGRKVEQGSSHQFYPQYISFTFRTAALFLYLRILQSQHLHEVMVLLFHLSEIINKELTRKVHRFVQEAPIKMPPCIADKAQST